MSKKTITKKIVFVICLLSLAAGFFACSHVASKDKKINAVNASKEYSKSYLKPRITGKIESDEITESSGMAASKCQADVFWTHNDSGDNAFVFALNGKGAHLGTWRVSGAKNIDWEDIATFKNAAGECFLYVGDIGNNSLKREELTIYLVKEPQIGEDAKSSTRKNPLETAPAEAIKFNYPDKTHNAETLLIHPQSREIYVLTKEIESPAGIYKLPRNQKSGERNQLEKLGELSVPAIPNGLLTGGSISPDGKCVVLCDYFSGYELLLPNGAKNFDEIWKQKPLAIDLGERGIGEAVTYSSDGNSIFAVSEDKNSPIVEVKKR